MIIILYRHAPAEQAIAEASGINHQGGSTIEAGMELKSMITLCWRNRPRWPASANVPPADAR
jgi:hypothetical protein